MLFLPGTLASSQGGILDFERVEVNTCRFRRETDKTLGSAGERF
jgi:hypothetical protein